MQSFVRWLLIVPCGFVACRTGGGHTRTVFDDGFRVAEFTAADRVQQVATTLPAIAAIFDQNARANHYVGQIWGVVVDGELIHSSAFGVSNIETERAVDVHSKFHIASMTKSFTSMAILKLRDAGALSLRDPVSRHIPELSSLVALTSDAPPIVIEHLMTMTSGLPEDNPWADRQLEDSTAELLDLIATGLSFSTVPGSAYQYSNLGYAMLGTIITRVSGRPYQRYITEQILEPLEMFETHWDYSDVPPEELAQGYRWEDDRWKAEPMLHSGAFGSIGGLITSMHDFSKYVAFHLSAWPSRSGAEDGPVRRSTVREMHVPTQPRLVANATDANGEPCPYLIGYGYGLGIRQDCHGVTRVSHTGGLPGFGSNVQFFPDYGVGLISFANLRYAASSAQHEAANAVLFAGDRIRPRTLPVSTILARRARQVAELVRTWDGALGDEILADNFYLDLSRDHRARAAERILSSAGSIVSIDDVVPMNQLRGTFVMHGEMRDVSVFFTLSPERPAKVQRIDIRLSR